MTITGFIKTFCGTVGILSVSSYVFSNYENITYQWWQPLIKYFIIGLVFVLVNNHKVMASIPITGVWIILRDIFNNINIINESFIVSSIISLLLIIVSEILLADEITPNKLFPKILSDVLFSAILILGVYENASNIFSTEYLENAKMLIIFAFSLAVAAPSPTKLLGFMKKKD